MNKTAPALSDLLGNFCAIHRYARRLWNTSRMDGLERSDMCPAERLWLNSHFTMEGRMS
jgi:hypothetical protein